MAYTTLNKMVTVFINNICNIIRLRFTIIRTWLRDCFHWFLSAESHSAKSIFTKLDVFRV